MKKRRTLLLLIILLLIILIIKRIGMRAKPVQKVYTPKPIKEEILHKNPFPKISKKKIVKRPRHIKERRLPTSPAIDTIGIELQVITPAMEVVERELNPEERGEMELKIGRASEKIKEELGGLPYPMAETKPRLIRATKPPESLPSQVFVRAVVEKDGTINRLKVEKSSGDVHLDSLIIVTAKEFRFLPGLFKNNPVKVEIIIPFE